MECTGCPAMTDRSGKELVEHGSELFPAAFYVTRLEKENVAWHWHDEWEAGMVQEGKAVLLAGGERYVLGPGEGFFINGGVLHGLEQEPGCAGRFVSVVFHPRLVGGSRESVFYRNYTQPLLECGGLECCLLKGEEAWQREALQALEEAWQAGTRAEDGYELDVRGELSRLVFLVGRRLPANPAPAGGRTARNAQRIKTMMRYVHEHYEEELTVDGIAASAMVSRSECLRCFKETIGTAPMQYVKRYRLHRAAGLLLSTREKVEEIAFRCGFQDVSYFIKSFKGQEGCTPAEYRQRGGA